MKKFVYLFIFLFVLHIVGCDNQVVDRSKNTPPPAAFPNIQDNNNYSNKEQNRLAINPEALEVLAQEVGKSPDELTWEDLQNIRTFHIDHEKKAIGNALKYLENLETLYINIPIDLSFLPELESVKFL